MAAPFRLTLVPGCRRSESSPEQLQIETPRGPLALGTAESARATVADQLLTGGATEDELVRAGVAGRDHRAIHEVYGLLFGLHERLALRREVWAGSELLATADPIAPSWDFGVERLEDRCRVILSRFALLRRRTSARGSLERGAEGGLMAESPRSKARVSLQSSRAAMLFFELARPQTWPELAQAVSMDEETVRLFCDLLWQAGLLLVTDELGRTDEERRPALRHWEFHDLLFHARSRAGRHDRPHGAVFPFRGEIEPLPAVKPAPAWGDDTEGEVIELYRPDLERLWTRDPPLTQVLEERRSERRHGEPAISAEQLGEFLFRTARAREVIEREPYSIAPRIYPGGGGAWELEVYPVVGRARGVESGLYHYRPLEHRLARLSGQSPEWSRLLANASAAVEAEVPVQILMVFAARFRRLSWKYSSMAYATVLKDVGVLYQTMYLVATAMELSVCAVGGGDSDLFAAAAGSEYYEETSVGEILLGTRGDGLSDDH